MNSISDLPTEAFEPKLSNLNVKILQVMTLGLVFAPVALAGGVMWFGLSGGGAPRAPEGGVVLAHYLSAAHLAILLVAVPLTWTVMSSRFRRSALERYARDGLHAGENSHLTDPADIAMHLVRLETILPLAALEGASLAGIAATFLAVNEGSIHQSMFYWLNLGTVGLLVLRGILAFPSTERLRRVFITRIKKRAA